MVDLAEQNKLKLNVILMDLAAELRHDGELWRVEKLSRFRLSRGF